MDPGCGSPFWSRGRTVSEEGTGPPAVAWLSGALPPEEAIHGFVNGIVKYPNVGVELVDLVRQSTETEAHLFQLMGMLTNRQLRGEDAQAVEGRIATNNRQQSIARTHIGRARAKLWGEDETEGDGK